MESMHRRSGNLLLLITLLAFAVSFTLLTGCAALISGYNSEFQCPDTDKGKCVSVKTAYEESLHGQEENPLVKEKQCDGCNTSAQQPSMHNGSAQEEQEPEYSYRDALFKKLSSMIGQPSTPLVVPPHVMRVLILSYTGSDNELFTYRYVYFFATEPEWVISTSKEAH